MAFALLTKRSASASGMRTMHANRCRASLHHFASNATMQTDSGCSLMCVRQPLCLARSEFIPRRSFTQNSSTPDASTKTCWSCDKSLDRKQNRFFCEPCNVVQSPDKAMDYFELFELPKSYKIDRSALAKFRNQLQRQLHPDHFQAKSDMEQQLSREQSSFVNNAYNVLTNPFKRGDYLLEILGAGRIDENSLQGEVEFLSVIMELNEEIAENSTSPEKLQELKRDNEAKLERLEDDVTNAFEKNNISEARLLLCKMQYFTNIGEKLKDAIMHAELRPK